jgi:L-fuculose-phosphate aldolase
MNESSLRQELARYSRRIWERGWVANHDGNLSARLSRGRLLCTPTGLSKAELKPEAMLVVDETGKLLSGSGRPFSELNLHLAYYQARPDAQAVLHAHPPTATGFGVAGIPLDKPFLPEAVVSLGQAIPTVPLSLPGHEAAQSVAPYLEDHDALLLAGNGVITCGADLEQACLRLELVEHLARIALVAHQLGGITTLSAHYLPTLLAARTRAGLGPEARGRTPFFPSTVQSAAPSGDLEKIVREEVQRVLGEGRKA